MADNVNFTPSVSEEATFDINISNIYKKSALQSRKLFASMKMDIPFDEHSSIIGPGGRDIQQVSWATKTQIHFPDVNICSPRKSNQVSMRGTIRNIELARHQLREMTSLTFYFYIKREYSKQFITKALHIIKGTVVKLIHDESENETCIMLKGRQMHSDIVKCCTSEVMSCMPDACWWTSPVYNSIEILAETQPYVKGIRNSHIAEIEKSTGATITFQSHVANLSQDFGKDQVSNLPSRVVISGPNVQSVYAARKAILEHLPLYLTFQTERRVEFSYHCIPRKNDVKIDVREDKSTKMITLKTCEKNASYLYEIHDNFMGIIPAVRTSHSFDLHPLPGTAQIAALQLDMLRHLFSREFSVTGDYNIK